MKTIRVKIVGSKKSKPKAKAEKSEKGGYNWQRYNDPPQERPGYDAFRTVHVLLKNGNEVYGWYSSTFQQWKLYGTEKPTSNTDRGINECISQYVVAWKDLDL